MRRALVSVFFSLFLFLPASHGQTSSVTYSEMATNQLSAPTMVTVTPVPSCGVGPTTWTYAVAALDANGGTTTGTSGSTSVGCATLSTTVYNKIVITAVTGSAGCNVYRTSGTNTGKIATVPCGSTYFDMTGGAGDGSSVPGINSTGSVVARGTVTAQNFLSSGAGAGTSDWVQGLPLLLCTQGSGSVFTQPQPCIQSGSFFLQAPGSGISSSFGWTAPSLTNTFAGPLIVGPEMTNPGYASTSALSVGYLTDTTINPTTQPTLATVLTPLNANHLVSLANPSGSNIDLVDSGIALSGAVIPYANETIPTFDSTATGLVAPAGDATFTFPTAATNGLTLSGTIPTGSAGTNASLLLTVNGVPGAPNSTTGTGTGGVGSQPTIAAGNGGAATGSGTTAATVGGAGGAITLTSGNGGQGMLGNDSGGSGGNIVLMTGAGGNAHGSGNNPNGGNVVVSLGSAGTLGSGTAGSAGQLKVTGTQPSPNSTGSGFAVGTIVNIAGVPGGNTTFSGGTGGTGSAVSINSGAGGSGTGAATGSGGAGGAINIAAGGGGSAASGGTAGSGGNIVLTAGGVGTGGTGGSAGIIQAASDLQIPAGTATAPALQFSSNSNGFYLPAGTGPTYSSSGAATATFFNTGTTGGLAVGSSGTYSMTSGSSTGTIDTGIARGAAGLVNVNGSSGSATGFVKTSQSLIVQGADFSTSSTTLTPITGLSITLPSVTANWGFSCDLILSQATSTTGDVIGVQTPTNAPSALSAGGFVASLGTNAIADVSSTVAQPIVTFGTAGGTNYPAHIGGGISGSSSSGTTFQLVISTNNALHAIKVYQGSSCWVY